MAKLSTLNPWQILALAQRLIDFDERCCDLLLEITEIIKDHYQGVAIVCADSITKDSNKVSNSQVLIDFDIDSCIED